MILPPSVTDTPSATQFVFWCLDNIGMGYHPDTAFSEYEDETGKRLFTDDEAEELDALNSQVFDHICPYEIGLAEMRRRMGYAAESDELLPSPDSDIPFVVNSGERAALNENC